MDDLVQELNLASFDAFKTPTNYNERTPSSPAFYYKSSAKRIVINAEAGMIIKFPPVLETILGLSPTQNPIVNTSNEKLTVEGDFACDLQAGIHGIYVYCDLPHYVPVGDIKAPLLRVVSTAGKAGNVISRYYICGFSRC